MGNFSDLDLESNDKNKDKTPEVVVGGETLLDKDLRFTSLDMRYEVVKLFTRNLGCYYIVDHRDGYVLGKNIVDADDLEGEYAYGHAIPERESLLLTEGFDTWREANGFIVEYLLDTMMTPSEIAEEGDPRLKEQRQFDEHIERGMRAHLDERGE